MGLTEDERRKKQGLNPELCVKDRLKYLRLVQLVRIELEK